MNCRTCDYPLWNLKARQCPECGSPFVPGDFEFVVNSVRFCCPHCDQCYYGTDQRGHLVPREFACVKCGQRIDMDQMVLRPAEGVSERQTQIDHMPWLERTERPWHKRFGLTIFGSMFRPASIMRAVPNEGCTGTAWWFAFQCFGLFLLCGIGLPFLAIGIAEMLRSGRQSGESLAIAAVVVFGGTAGLLAITALWGLTAHGLLRISGGANQPLGRTMQAFCFSSGALSILGIPCVGMYCGNPICGVWWVVSAVLMLAQAQKVHGGRAAFAVITPVLAALLAGGAVVFGVVYVATTQNPGIFNPAVGAPQLETRYVVQGIIDFAAAHNGQGPPHAAQLVIDNGLGADNFVSATSSNTTGGVPVADTTLDKFERLPRNRRQIAATAAANALPKEVIAHRLGDFVFTYHGMNLSNPDPNLWIVVLYPELPTGGSGTSVAPVAGLADGSTRQLPGPWPAELAAQNALRTAAGLPPLPDLSSVTHQTPASGSHP